VPGVREAQLRPNPGGVHTLRLELADDADPGRVSREVARLLKERMGLAAEPRESREAAAGAVAGALPAPVSVPVGPTARHHEPAPEHSLTREPPPLRETRRRHGVPATRRATDPVRLHREVPPRPLPGGAGGPRVRLDRVEIGTQGTDAMVEVRLTADGTPAYGVASGPAFDGYVLRLAAVAAANAVDELLTEPDGSARARCYVEHAAVVPFGTVEVAVVVMLLACGGWVEQLSGSALVGTDPQNAVVRATLDAVNRRLEALLP